MEHAKKAEKAVEAEEDGPAKKKEAKFDYRKMNYYEIMDADTTADEKQLKQAYLRAARKYHPDVYKGVNQTHFQKVTEVYNLLKNPLKRKDYDHKQKIHRMRDNKKY